MSDRLDGSDGCDPAAAGFAGDVPERTDLVEKLLRMADVGPEIPENGADRIKEAIRPQWRHQVRARSRGRRIGWLAAGLAAAATLLVALLLVPPGVRVPAGPVATIASVRGSVEVVSATGRVETTTAAEIGSEIVAGTWVRTGDDSRVALQLSRGQSLRLDHATGIRIGSAVQVELDHGGVYVDSAGAEAGGVEIQTAFGVARDLGTQFEVRRDRSELAIRVREGVVMLVRADEEINIARGTAVRVLADGTVETSRIPVFGKGWDWVQQVAPPFEIEGRSVVAFLDWVARETGLQIRYSSPAVARFAAETVLHGTVEGVMPTEAPGVVLPTCGLAARDEAGTLTVRRIGD